MPTPVIVVEVLSPTTRHIDKSKKLADYMTVPSTQHYLIVDDDDVGIVTHHPRSGGTISA